MPRTERQTDTVNRPEATIDIEQYVEYVRNDPIVKRSAAAKGLTVDQYIRHTVAAACSDNQETGIQRLVNQGFDPGTSATIVSESGTARTGTVLEMRLSNGVTQMVVEIPAR